MNEKQKGGISVNTENIFPIKLYTCTISIAHADGIALV